MTPSRGTPRTSRGEPRTRRAVHVRDLTVRKPGQNPDRRPEGHRQTPKGTQTAPQPDPQPQHDSQAPKDARRHTERRRTPQTSQRERGDDQKLRESNPRPSAPSGGGQTNAKRGGSEGQRGRANNGPATTQAAAQPRAPASEGISSAKGIPDARKSTTSHTGLGQQPRTTAPHPHHGAPNHEEQQHGPRRGQPRGAADPPEGTPTGKQGSRGPRGDGRPESNDTPQAAAEHPEKGVGGPDGPPPGPGHPQVRK